MKDYREEIRRIMVSVNVIDGIYAMGAKKIGIKDNSLSLLYVLDDGKPHSQKEICEYWLIPKTTLNTIVKECVNAGYIV
ncbi:MarR family transcriptional regulator, partial [[Clostridium] symbiosum]|uniref:MarR family transcriptional regulator n=1 Tax=Clostridium symbiosum TaxID=1512 RepID=UPI0021087DE1